MIYALNNLIVIKINTYYKWQALFLSNRLTLYFILFIAHEKEGIIYRHFAYLFSIAIISFGDVFDDCVIHYSLYEIQYSYNYDIERKSIVLLFVLFMTSS